MTADQPPKPKPAYRWDPAAASLAGRKGGAMGGRGRPKRRGPYKRKPRKVV